MRTLSTLTSISAALALACAATASTVVQESFDYGPNPLPLAGLNGGTGFGAPWAFQSGDGNATYDPNGLTFSTLVTSGGKAVLAADDFGFMFTREFAAGVEVTGDLYASFLFRRTTDVDGDLGSGGLLIGGEDFTIGMSVDDLFSRNGSVFLGEWPNDVSSPLAGTGNSQDETLLALFHVSNVGATDGSAQTITGYILRDYQFDALKGTGSLTKAMLDAADVGTAAGDVLQRGSATLDPGQSDVSFSSTDGLVLAVSWETYEFDELRFSGDSFDAVTPIPEPAALGLVALAGVGLLRRRR